MQSDDLGLVPVAWRHRGPKGGWITTEKKQPWSEEPLYDAAAIERLVAERDEALAELKKTDGSFDIATRFNERHIATVEAQRDQLKEALQAMVRRFELYLGPDNIHAGHHDMALVERARQALGEAP